MKKVLFICSANIDRSPTAEKIYREYPGIETKSAGASWYAERYISDELVVWADIILCMEEWQKKFIQRKFAELMEGKQIESLNVPDNYHHMDPELISIMKEKVDPWIHKLME